MRSRPATSRSMSGPPKRKCQSNGFWIICSHGPTPGTGASITTSLVTRSGCCSAMRTLAKEPGRENVEAVSADLVAMPQATQPADVLWLHLFYHDLHTALIQARGATAARFNRAVYQ